MNRRLHLQDAVRVLIGLFLSIAVTTIVIAQEPVSDLPSLQFNEIITGTFTEDDRQPDGEFRHQYRFDAQAGDVIRVRAEAVGPAALAYVSITAPGGDDLLRAEPYFSPEIRSEAVTLQQSGTYTLTVARTETGAYDLNLIRRETPHLDRDDSGTSEYLYARVEQLNYTFDGSAGEQVVLSASSPRLDVVMEVYAPDGTLLASDDDSGANFDARLDPLTLPDDGTYRIVLRAYADGGSGNLHLSLEDYDPTLLRVSQEAPLTLTIAPDDAPQNFLIQGWRGDVWALRSDHLDQIDVQLSDYRPLSNRREGEQVQPGVYEYIPLPLDRTYRLTIWYEDMDAEPIDLTIVQIAENALDTASHHVTLSRKTPSRTLVFRAVNHLSATGKLRVEQFEQGEMRALHVDMQLDGETFFAYTMADVIGMTALQMSTDYRMPDVGIVTVTVSLVDADMSDKPIAFTVTNTIIDGPG